MRDVQSSGESIFPGTPLALRKRLRNETHWYEKEAERRGIVEGLRNLYDEYWQY